MYRGEVRHKEGRSLVNANGILVLVIFGLLYLILAGIWLRRRRYSNMARGGVVCPAVVAGYERMAHGMTSSAVLYVRAATPEGEKLLAGHHGYAGKPFGDNRVYRRGDAVDVYYNERYPADFLLAGQGAGEEEAAAYEQAIPPKAAGLITAGYWVGAVCLSLSLMLQY